MFLAHFTSTPFDYLLDLDVMTFNSLLDAAQRLDGARWTQQAWLSRVAQHGDQKQFSKMVTETWGSPKDDDAVEKPQGKGIGDLLRAYGGGF